MAENEQKLKVDTVAVQKAAKDISSMIAAGFDASVKQLSDELDNRIRSVVPRESFITIRGSLTKKTIKGVSHPQLQEVLDLLRANEIPLLVGPAGCGKSYLAEQVAEIIDAIYGELNCSGGVTEGRIFGRMVPNITTGEESYRASDWINLYDLADQPSLYLFDEFDALDENVALAINAALVKGFASVPDPDANRRSRARDKHGNFIHHIVATANTYGHGADRIYSGRNQMDGATLDRFFPVPMDYDRDLERTLATQYGNPTEILNTFWRIRERARQSKLERIVSTRWIERAAKMRAMGWTMDRILDRFFAGWSSDEMSAVRQ